jgi:hypothetical protein
MVPGSIPGGVTGDFFCGSFRQNHVPWGQLSLWKWVPGISPGVKATSTYVSQPTTLVVPNVGMIHGLNLTGTPRATLACRRRPLLFTLLCHCKVKSRDIRQLIFCIKLLLVSRHTSIFKVLLHCSYVKVNFVYCNTGKWFKTIPPTCLSH